MERVPVPRKIWYAVIASYVSGILVTGSGLVYMNHVDTESNRKWCSLVVTLDETYRQTPPTTEVGRKVAVSINGLRQDFRC